MHVFELILQTVQAFPTYSKRVHDDVFFIGRTLSFEVDGISAEDYQVMVDILGWRQALESVVGLEVLFAQYPYNTQYVPHRWRLARRAIVNTYSANGANWFFHWDRGKGIWGTVILGNNDHRLWALKVERAIAKNALYTHYNEGPEARG